VYIPAVSSVLGYGLRCSGMLRSVDRSLLADISGPPIGPVFKGKAVLEDGTDRLSRNVGNYQSTLRNIQEERRYNLCSGGSLK